MKLPSFKEENKLWKNGYKKVIGLDEAGRGPLAGPVIAAAVAVKPKTKDQKPKIFNEVKNSKQLSAKKREELYKIITRSPFIKWGIGRVSEKVIDKINILEATKLAMERAIKNLEKKLNKSICQNSRDRANFGRLIFAQKIHNCGFFGQTDYSGLTRQESTRPSSTRPTLVDFLLLDGNFSINLKIPQKSIIKGDEKVFSCALASILAKVARDRIMRRYHKKYPEYGFDRHKGYPTKYHRAMIKKYGICEIHRRSFKMS